MNKICLCLLAAVPLAFSQDVVSAVEGTLKKIDAGTKTCVIATADGTEHTLRFIGRTTVHGTEAGAKDMFHGLKEGSHVVAHYTKKGAVETAQEVDNLNEGGMKAAEVSVTHIDRAAKTIAVKTASGAEETYKLADHAAVDAGKDIAAGTEKQ